MGSESGQTLKDKTASVVRVSGARGFVVDMLDIRPRAIPKGVNAEGISFGPFEWSETESVEIRSRIIVTAAHCLPIVDVGVRQQYIKLSPGHWGSQERTFENLVGPLGGEASIWVECLYADPIADVALLGEPDLSLGTVHEELVEPIDPSEWAVATATDEYNECFDAVPPLEFGSGDPSSVWVLDLSNEWREVRGVQLSKRSMHFADGARLEGGMSGGPILDGGGQIVGLVSTSLGVGGSEERGDCPRLPHTLPRWFPGNE